MIPSAVAYFAFAVFPIGMAYAAASDLLTMTIPNRVTIGLLVAFVALVPFTGIDPHTLLMHAAAGGVVLAIAFACFAFGWIGGGDAKLAAVAALWLGWEHLAEFVGLSAVLGGGLTLLILSFRGSLLPAVVMRQDWVARLHDKREGVPYGIALAAGALAVYPGSLWMGFLVG